MSRPHDWRRVFRSHEPDWLNERWRCERCGRVEDRRLGQGGRLDRLDVVQAGIRLREPCR